MILFFRFQLSLARSRIHASTHLKIERANHGHEGNAQKERGDDEANDVTGSAFVGRVMADFLAGDRGSNEVAMEFRANLFLFLVGDGTPLACPLLLLPIRPTITNQTSISAAATTAHEERQGEIIGNVTVTTTF